VSEWAPPVLGGRIVSRQGCRRAQTDQQLHDIDLVLCPGTDVDPRRRWHNGVDIVGPHGAQEGVEVLAPLAGRLRYAYQIDGCWVAGRDEGSGGYGRSAVLEHASGVLTLYAHLSWVRSDVGAWLERGELVGRIGRTAGRREDPCALITTPHVHHEWLAAWPLRSEQIDKRYDVLASLAACGIVETVDNRLVYGVASEVVPAAGASPGPSEPANAGPALAALLAWAALRRRRGDDHGGQ
jgi:murein DD-endopeptidase MepM/ murein hydrolase activator NlpD